MRGEEIRTRQRLSSNRCVCEECARTHCRLFAFFKIILTVLKMQVFPCGKQRGHQRLHLVLARVQREEELHFWGRTGLLGCPLPTKLCALTPTFCTPWAEQPQWWPSKIPVRTGTGCTRMPGDVAVASCLRGGDQEGRAKLFQGCKGRR